MTADDVIDSYVRDVAAHLPRAKRNDVAFELRALLADDLAARAEAEGRAPDKAMAMDLLKGFGRPAEAARRYHERPAIIDPADTHHFVIWTLGGAAALGILSALDQEGTADGDLFLEWLGVLVIFFSLAAWWRRRNPDAMGWNPKGHPDVMPRGLALLACVATVIFPIFMYAAPETFSRTLFLGHVPTGGLALAEPFRDSLLRMVTLASLILTAGLYAVVAIAGRWRGWSRWTSLAANAALGALFSVHAATEVFVSDSANVVGRPIFGMVGAIYLLSLLYEAYREWVRISPAPALDREQAA